MSFDFTVKPVGQLVIPPVVRPEPEVVQKAVATQLPAPQSVTATANASGSNAVASNAAKVGADTISRQVIFDQASAAMVYVSVDQSTAEVINQYPDSWQLKARAYFREQDQSKLQPRSGPIPTDRTA
ncbi:hypothetical protein [Rhodopseudomonas pseudopalustris]|uniref:Uncharacterized protein n=1 Tax=Rhodopseudomonas pseudopalustris TaxID=1513892 RepID=A0A1H8UUA9_9BRAD|nr:hypothetical protein [Rhodopseudomonas pseudopalustris]SEP06514.1 hypothetical protein SAMN05444123_107237 [Rhodopseudomonas pseudopalustris]